MESTGFVAQVATTSSQNSTPVAKSQPDQPPRRIERTQEELKELRGKIFCRYGLSCRGSKDGTCEFNHDPNHPKWKTHPLNPGATPSKDFPPPPVPKWDFNRCKQLGICWQWMKNGTCVLEQCRFTHDEPKEDGGAVPKIQTIRTLDMYVTQSEWRHLNEVNHEQFVIDNNLVLLDSGSNELVRPYNGWEWQQIVDKNHIQKGYGSDWPLISVWKRGLPWEES